MDLKRELDKITRQRGYLDSLDTSVEKKEAEAYYTDTFQQKILTAANESEYPNQASFSTTEDDLKYFSYLSKIALRSKIFVYLTVDSSTIVVKWS